MSKETRIVIGPATPISLPEFNLVSIPARVDTGAKTSSIWASGIKEVDGHLEYVLFGPSSKFYTGEKQSTTTYEIRSVASSTGDFEKRYTVSLVVLISGRRIRTAFTLANRSRQAYPILLGRNILRGKFIVDVKLGKLLHPRNKSLKVQRKGQS